MAKSNPNGQHRMNAYVNLEFGQGHTPKNEVKSGDDGDYEYITQESIIDLKCVVRKENLNSNENVELQRRQVNDTDQTQQSVEQLPQSDTKWKVLTVILFIISVGFALGFSIVLKKSMDKDSKFEKCLYVHKRPM